MYRDPEIPAIVSEELWDRANVIFRAHSARSRAHGQGGRGQTPLQRQDFLRPARGQLPPPVSAHPGGGKRILAVQALPGPGKGGLSPAGPLSGAGSWTRCWPPCFPGWSPIRNTS